MIKLNLISPNYKKIIKTKRILYNVKNIFLYITLFTVTIATILLITRKFLEDNLLEEIGRTTLISRGPQGNQRIAGINKKIILAQEVQADYIPWSRLIINFSKLIPDNTNINSLKISPDKNDNEWQMTISGTAAHRDDFLILKKNLLVNNDFYKNVDIPIDSLFKKDNIGFNISMMIEKDSLIGLAF